MTRRAMPLIGRGADNQHIPKALGRDIARRVVPDPCRAQFFVTIHIGFTAFQIHFLNCLRRSQNLIGYSNCLLYTSRCV